MWFWLISSIAGSIIGSATESWFRDTKLGVWFYNKIDSLYTWASMRYGLKLMTDEEKRQVDEWENRNQRELRNGRLTETDWTQLPDCPLTKEKVIEFREYRKYLRDLPTKNGWPHTHQVPGPPKISED